MSRAARLCALAVTLLGCGEPPPAVAGSDAATPVVAERFVAGDVLRYRFDWRVDTSSDAAGILPDDMQLEAGLVLAGEVVFRVYPSRPDGSVLGVTLASLDEHAITMMGQNALPDPSELLDREVIAIVDEDGAVTSLLFAHDAPPLLRHLVPGLLAQADLRLPARGGEGAASVPAGSGVADVDYTWSGPSVLARSLRGYTRFDAFASASAPAVDGRLEITLDDHGLPLRMEGDERLSATDDREQSFSSHTRFAFERIAQTHEAPRAAPVLTELARLDPFAPPDDAEAQRLLAQRFARGLSDVDVELAVYAADAGLRPEPSFIVRATGRLRGWPELASELEPMFAQFQDPHARSLVIDMLASAGTPQAQAVMCRLLGTADVRALPEYAGWVQRFAFLWRPLPGTARFLLDEHALARTEGVARSQQALLYPMGTVARRITALDPVVASALRVRMREDLAAAHEPKLVIAALAGLGNAAAAEDLELVLAHEHDAEPGVRAAVASALRLQPSPSATDAQLRLLVDREPFVADVALTALDERHAGTDDSLRLAGVALGGAYVPDVAARLTSALLRRLHDDPWVRAALLAMRTRTHDPRERQRIDDTLATVPG